MHKSQSTFRSMGMYILSLLLLFISNVDAQSISYENEQLLIKLSESSIHHHQSEQVSLDSVLDISTFALENELQDVYVEAQSLLSLAYIKTARYRESIAIHAEIHTLTNFEANPNAYLRSLSSSVSGLLMLGYFDQSKVGSDELETLVNKPNNAADDVIAFAYLTIGQQNIRTKNYIYGIEKIKLALNLISNSTDMNEKTKSSLLITAYNYIASSYYVIGDFKSAINYFESAYTKSLINNNITLAATYQHNIASAQLDNGEYEKAYYNAINSSLKAKSVNAITIWGFSNMIIGESLSEMGRNDEATTYILESISIFNDNEMHQSLVSTFALYTNILVKNEHWDKAFIALNKTIELGLKYEQHYSDLNFNEAAYQIYEHNGDYEKAFDSHITFSTMQNKGALGKHEIEAQKLMMTLDLDHANNKAIALDKDNKLKSIIIAKKEHQEELWASSLYVVFGLLLIAFGFYYRERSTRASLLELAMTDALTGCPNRRFVLNKAKHVIKEQLGKNSPIAIALIDLDYFKSINDNYGHDVGDEVLTRFVDTCSSFLRKGDTLGRYGGEEFMLVLPNSDINDVELVFKRMQASLKHLKCETKEGLVEIPITISMGAVVETSALNLNNATDVAALLKALIKVADEQVYVAKHGGRDQLSCVS